MRSALLSRDGRPRAFLFFRVFFIAAVGKSAILLQFTERQFRDAHDMTIGVEFGAKDVSIGDAQVGRGYGTLNREGHQS